MLAAEQDKTVLLTTHYLEEADQLAARVAIVDRGKVVTEGTPDELKSELHGDAVYVDLAGPEGPGRQRIPESVGAGLPGHDWSEEMKAAWGEEEAAFEAGDLDKAVEISLRTWVDGPRRKPEDVDADVRARVGEMQRRAYELQRSVQEDEEELLVEDVAERLGEIRAPTLVVVGEEDVPDIHTIADRLAREIPGARRASIPNAAHAPSMERPREFEEAMLGFLESIE